MRALTNRETTTNETSDHREDNYVQEMLSSAEYSWLQPLNGQRRRASGVRNGHGFGVANALTRSASHGDLHNDGIEYVTVQRVQRVDDGPSHRRHGVYRFENYNRDRHQQQFRRTPEQHSPDFETSPPADIRTAEYDEDPDFEEEEEEEEDLEVEDEDDYYETASEIISDRDSSFTSTTAATAAAPFSGSRVSINDYYSINNHSHINRDTHRPHDVVVAAAAATASSPSSTAAVTQSANSESSTTTTTTASVSGCERLYDIAPQIEAAMLDIERLSLQFGRTRHAVTTQTPATPLTHRSCFQLSDDEEEDVEWNARLRDAVFIVDDVDTDSDSDEASSDPASPFDDVELNVALHQMADAQWISSVEEDPYSYY